MASVDVAGMADMLTSSSTHVWYIRFLSNIASCDVAGLAGLAGIAYHITDTHFEPSF
jgi:hypothetical protein